MINNEGIGNEVVGGEEQALSNPESLLFEGERFASGEEVNNFWTEDRSKSAESAIDIAQNFGKEHGNDSLEGFTPDDIALIIDENADTVFGYYHQESNAVSINIPCAPDETGGLPESKVQISGGFELTRSISHELSHMLVTSDFREAQKEIAEKSNVDPTDTLQLINEAVVSEATYAGLVELEPGAQAVHTQVYSEAWMAFSTLCENIADELPEYDGNEANVIRDFEKWMFTPGSADEMSSVLERTFGDDFHEVVDLLSNYEESALDRHMNLPANRQKYDRLMELIG